jgi:hypothetical protein
MKLPSAGYCAWCAGVLRSTEERAARLCWLCALLNTLLDRRRWVRN